VLNKNMENQQIVKPKGQGVSLIASPAKLLQDGKRAAEALIKVVKQNGWSVKIQGNDYLCFEAWQTVAKFYGMTVKTVETQHVEYGGVEGFESKSVVIDSQGREVGGAEGLCMTDEGNWKNKPLYAIKSMAQTRSGAKALRQVLSWVVVLAGYKATPVEEMDGITPVTNGSPVTIKPKVKVLATDFQLKKILALLPLKGKTKEDIYKAYNITSLNDLEINQASAIVDRLSKVEVEQPQQILNENVKPEDIPF
jgi:hypothetical protein